MDLGSKGTVTPRIDWSYRSLTTNDNINSPFISQPGYSLFNASISFDSADEAWRIIAGIKNLSDERYLISGAFSANTGVVEGTYARPREWFLSVKRSF